MTDYWFKPKAHGYGAAPANAKGWLAILAYVVVDLILAAVFIVLPVLSGDGPTALQIILWIILMIVVTLAFVRISSARTDGEWRWRWGDK